MTFLGMRKYPTPVNGPMMPFFIGGVVMFFTINSLASSMMANDPQYSKTKPAAATKEAH